MRKDQFIELVKISLSGGTPPQEYQGKFHNVVIEKHIEMAFNEVVSNIQDPSIIDQFCVIHRNVPVLIDEDLGLKYSDLPSSVLNTVYFRGLRLISPMKDQTNVFFIRKNNSTPVMNRLQSNDAVYSNTARLEGPKRVYYDRISGSIDEVLIKMVSTFSEIASDDDIEMPGGKDGIVFRMVMEAMSVQMQTPENMRNDNNPNSI